MNGAIEFNYYGVSLRYNSDSGKCWRKLKLKGWKLIPAGTGEGYTCVGVRGRNVGLHRIVAEVFINGGRPIPEHLVVDHVLAVNGSHWQDRLENLRIVTPAENSRNRGVGNLYVAKHPVTGLWQIKVSGTTGIIGTYKSEREAGLAYLSLPKRVAA